MSSQRGNNNRTRSQKHQNRSAFKNDMHDTSRKTKTINSTSVGDVCTRCKDIIEWKIKYKKYKPLTQPKTCTKCAQKSVKIAYHVICTECVHSLRVCAKCLQSKEIHLPPLDKQNQIKFTAEMKYALQSLSERQRRSFIRFAIAKTGQDKMIGKLIVDKLAQSCTKEIQDDLIEKLTQLKLESKNDCNFDDIIDSDAEEME